MMRFSSPLCFCLLVALGGVRAQSSWGSSTSSSSSSYNSHSTAYHNTIDDANLTATEKMCSRLGYDPKKNYDNSYDRYWSPTSSSNAHLKTDPKCQSAKSNPRDHYTAHLQPCNFTFHTIPEETYSKVGPMELSTMCSKDNEKTDYGGGVASTLQDYVYNWPDECVGDYKRCYSVKREENIIAAMFCKKHWTIPEGVTHVAVECTTDKETKIKQIEEKESKKEEEDGNLTKTEQMCVRNGYDLHRTYDTSYDRYWSTTSSSNKYTNYKTSCESPKSNPRDHYTAHLEPCNFTFHKIPDEHHEGLGPMELSTRCSKKNEFHGSSSTTLQDYVHNWPDECVGDFQRCYSVERDEKIIAARFCHKHWTIPEGVTHIGVDCSLDKTTKLHRMNEKEEEEEKKEEEIETLSRTQQICTRLGYDLNKIYENSYESRHWYAGDSNTELRNNQPCASRQSNPRAKYTAHLSPCNFTFHSIPEEDHSDLGPMQLSTKCSSTNEYGTTISSSSKLEDYVQSWPDECVGDFQRCYSVERDQKIFARMFCHKHWTIPDGVTHIGVDCSTDKGTKLQKIKEKDEERKKKDEERRKKGLEPIQDSYDETDKLPFGKESYYIHHEQELKEVISAITFAVFVLIAFCAVSMLCAYKKVLKPFIPKPELKDPGYEQIHSFEMNNLVHNPSARMPPVPNTAARAPASPTQAPRGDLSFRLLDKA